MEAALNRKVRLAGWIVLDPCEHRCHDTVAALAIERKRFFDRQIDVACDCLAQQAVICRRVFLYELREVLPAGKHLARKYPGEVWVAQYVLGVCADGARPEGAIVLQNVPSSAPLRFVQHM